MYETGEYDGQKVNLKFIKHTYHDTSHHTLSLALRFLKIYGNNSKNCRTTSSDSR